jgi:hypothetical protein
LTENFLVNSTDEAVDAEVTGLPKCFISYSWDSPAHEEWVLNLATRIQQNGVKVILDKWDLQYGDDLPHFMETAVRDSDFVILVCTLKYARKADAGSGGTGYEKRIVTGEMFHSQKPSKFVPLVREGSDENALPTFLGSSFYIDFRRDSDFEQRLMDLLHQLHSHPKFPRPELGKSPFDDTKQNQQKRGQVQTIPNLPPPLNMAMQMPTVSDAPKPEDLQLRGATPLGSFGQLSNDEIRIRILQDQYSKKMQGEELGLNADKVASLLSIDESVANFNLEYLVERRLLDGQIVPGPGTTKKMVLTWGLTSAGIEFVERLSRKGVVVPSKPTPRNTIIVQGSVIGSNIGAGNKVIQSQSVSSISFQDLHSYVNNYLNESQKAALDPLLEELQVNVKNDPVRAHNTVRKIWETTKTWGPPAVTIIEMITKLTGLKP